MIRLFNSAALPVLFCTSTLIEGVNTAAKSVLIFDKKINRADYDFFTFSNIRGRAGRLGQHHVGNVYLFNEPPDRREVEVAPTLFGDDESAPDDYVVHLDEAEANSDISERLVALRRSLGVDAEGLRLASALGLDDALAIKERVDEIMPSSVGLVWSGYPNYNNIGEVISLICDVRRANDFGAFTPRQLTYLISQLRSSTTMRGFFLGHDIRFSGEERTYDNIFRFLRACEYGLPQLFSVVELFAKQHNPSVDYSLFVREMSRWFRPEVLKNLDEEGVPIQISERVYENNDSRQTLVARLIRAVTQRGPEFTDFELEWLSAALDVQ